MARRLRQRHEHLPVTAFIAPHVVLDDRVAAGEAVLLLQAFEYPLGRVPLLARRRSVRCQDAVDDANKSVQLRALCPPSAPMRQNRHLE